MGFPLYREVKKWAPESLTHREKLTAMVLADDANDVTRLTYSSVIDPEILRQAMVRTERDMRKVLARLVDEKVLEHVGGGHNGRVAKYRFLLLEPAGSSDVGGPKKTSYAENDQQQMFQNEPPTDDVGGLFRNRRGSKKDLPTPPTSSTTSSSPEAAPDARAEQDGGGGGAQQHNEQQLAQAAAFLQDLSAPWTAGRVTASALAPLLLENITAQGWQLDHALIGKLTENPGGISNYSAVLGKRIADLPKRATARQPAATPALPDWCGDCGDRQPLARSTAHLRVVEDDHGNRHPCPDCHPNAARRAS